MTKRAIGRLVFESTPTNVSTIVKDVLPLIGISFTAENIVDETPLAFEIRGKCGFSWKSSGEKIEIRISEIADGQTLVRAKSECVSSQLVDYGKNKKNLESLFAELAKRLKTTKPLHLE